MACSKFSLRMLVLVVIRWSLSTCSFENNNCLWTYPEAVKNPLVHLPHFCSQASGLLSPVVNSTVPTNTGSCDRNNVDFMESILPTVSIVPSVYIGSRSTDLHSPIPPSYITKSLFDLSLSLLSLTLLIVAVVLLLTIWMCYLVPVMSYMIVSSICETLSLSPMTLLNAMRKKKSTTLVSDQCTGLVIYYPQAAQFCVCVVN